MFGNRGEHVGIKQGCLSGTLDALVKQHGVPQPALLKIDVDGIEEDILNGAEQVLQSHELRTVLVELNQDTGDAAQVRKFHELGYQLENTGPRVMVDGFPSQNHIFRRVSSV